MEDSALFEEVGVIFRLYTYLLPVGLTPQFADVFSGTDLAACWVTSVFIYPTVSLMQLRMEAKWLFWNSHSTTLVPKQSLLA